MKFGLSYWILALHIALLDLLYMVTIGLHAIHSVVFLQGIGLIQDLISEYGLDVVQAYMNHIQV